MSKRFKRNGVTKAPQAHTDKEFCSLSSKQIYIIRDSIHNFELERIIKHTL